MTWSWRGDPGGVDEHAEAGQVRQRVHQAIAHDGLDERVVHGVDPGVRDAPLDGCVGVAQRAQHLGVDVRVHVRS